MAEAGKQGTGGVWPLEKSQAFAEALRGGCSLLAAASLVDVNYHAARKEALRLALLPLRRRAVVVCGDREVALHRASDAPLARRIKAGDRWVPADEADAVFSRLVVAVYDTPWWGLMVDYETAFGQATCTANSFDITVKKRRCRPVPDPAWAAEWEATVREMAEERAAAVPGSVDGRVPKGGGG